MADQRISQLTELGQNALAANDLLPIVDSSSSETKKITAKSLFQGAAALADNSTIDLATLNQSSATKFGTVAIADDAITAAKLANDSSVNYGPTEPATDNFEGRGHVSSTTKYLKVYDGSVYQQVIAPTAGIEDLAVNTSKLAANAVTTAKIDASGLAAAAIATDAVTTAKIQALAVTEAKIATGAVSATKLAVDAVLTAKIIDDAVTYAKIQNVTATDKLLGRATAGAGDIEEITLTAAGRALLDDADAATQRTTLGLGTLATQTGTVSGIHSGSSSGTNTGDQTITLTGDVSGTGTGSFATTIADSAVTTAKLPDSAITTAKIADDAVTADKLANQSTTVIAAVSPNINGVFAGQQWFNTVTKLQYMWDGSAWQQSAGIVDSFIFTDTTPLAFSAAVNSTGVATITTTLDTQSAATVFTGPTTGAAAAPTFRTLIATDLPIAAASTNGAVQPGTGLTVTGGGVLNHTNSATAGTYTKVTVDAQGHVSTGTTLSVADIPNIDTSKITTGTFAANLIGTSTITGEKLADHSTVQFGGAGSTANVVTFPVANFKGQLFWDELNNDMYIWSGSAWLSVTVTSGELILAGTFDASSGTAGAIAALTAAGTAAGFALGALPAPSASNRQFYFVVSIGGTPSTGQVSGIAFDPPDNILSTGAAWQKIDVSATVAGNSAVNITFTATGDIAATNVQTAIQELDTEKIPKTLTSANILVGNNSNVATSTAVTGDVTISNAGVTAIAAGVILNADIDASAAIVDTKLATIATAGKVSNSATTATSANTASTIVARDVSGNFTAGTITANLTGTASSATTAAACTGNAATVTTNANLTGDVTSVGNATAIGPGVIVNADIADGTITDAKLAQITTANKVSGSAITTGNISTTGSITTTSTLSVQGLTFGKGVGAISSNTAAGVNALNTNTTGFNNTAIGAGTLQANTQGDSNTAVGFDALNDNTIGIANTAVGRIALPINISGDNNTAVGVQTLSLNTVGDDNTAMGVNALFNTTSNENTAIGAYALSGNTTGTSNVAVGRAASFSKITGNNNTAIGANALFSNESGSNNVGIGHNCSSSNNTVSNEVNISNGTVLARFGGAATAWQFVSDVRDKTDIENLTLGLDFIKALKPRKFKWNLRNTEVDRGKPSAGFIAQEMLQAVEAFGASYTNLIDTNDPNQYTFAQANMIPILVKAVQELSAMVKQLQSAG